MVSNAINRGDVFLANLGFDGSSRQGGKRPVVIISNQMCNINSPIVSVVSLTTSKTKANLPTHIKLLARETGLRYDSICLCEQPMSISKSSLVEYITRLGFDHMRKVDDGLRCQLCL
jgi:mRNA interferase MazF